MSQNMSWQNTLFENLTPKSGFRPNRMYVFGRTWHMRFACDVFPLLVSYVLGSAKISFLIVILDDEQIFFSGPVKPHMVCSTINPFHHREGMPQTDIRPNYSFRPP